MLFQPPDATSRDELLEEWKVARDTCKSFDDLLMRIRTFALPLIATIVGAGSAFGTAGPRLNVPWEITLALIIGVALVLATIAWLLVRYTQDETLALGTYERKFLYVLPVMVGVWAAFFATQRPDAFDFPAPVLLFGGFVLFFIYLLDRFYYTSLLLGAVKSSQRIETTLGFDLTHSIVAVAPEWTYTLLPALLYLLPVIVLLNLGLAIVTFTGGAASAHAAAPLWI